MNRKYFLLGLFILILYGVWYLYRPFILPMSIAALLALATINLNFFFAKHIPFELPRALLMTLLLSLLFFAPIVYALNASSDIVNNFDRSIIEKIISLKNNFELPEYFGFTKPYIEGFLNSLNSQDIAKNIVNYGTPIIQKSAGFFKDMLLILVFYFFVNLYSKELVRFFKDILPFDKNSSFFLEISNVMSVVFYSTLLTAILEGTLFAIIIVFFGYNGLLFGILYGFASLIPIIGGALMWLPVALFEYANGHTLTAIIITLYSIVVISIIADTFVKPMIIKYVQTDIIKSRRKIHEIIVFFSIIAGLTTFGFWGVILGPAITTFFISFARIYQVVLDEEKTIHA